MYVPSDARPPSTGWRQGLVHSFRALKHDNYRVYCIGHVVSMLGTSMQSMALAWIAYEMTQSAAMLGLVALCTNAPILLLSLFGGTIADGHSRRKVIMITQWVEMAQAAVLFALVLTGALEVWMILVLSMVLGASMAFELPARHAFVADMVGREDLVNAGSINSIIYNVTRMMGPTIGAFLLSSYGRSVCFGLNALSFVAAIVSLYQLGTAALVQPAKPVAPQVTMWDGLKSVLTNVPVRNLMLLTLSMSFFGLQFTVLLPVFVHDVFKGSAHLLGWLMAASSVGSLVSGVILAGTTLPATLNRNIKVAAACLPATLMLFALSSNLWLTLTVELFIGVCVNVQLVSTVSALQLSVPQSLRGRVMGIYTMVVVGAMPLGSLVIGRVADAFGVQMAVAVCALSCTVAVVLYLMQHSPMSVLEPSSAPEATNQPGNEDAKRQEKLVGAA